MDKENRDMYDLYKNKIVIGTFVFDVEPDDFYQDTALIAERYPGFKEAVEKKEYRHAVYFLIKAIKEAAKKYGTYEHQSLPESDLRRHVEKIMKILYPEIKKQDYEV